CRAVPRRRPPAARRDRDRDDAARRRHRRRCHARHPHGRSSAEPLSGARLRDDPHLKAPAVSRAAARPFADRGGHRAAPSLFRSTLMPDLSGSIYSELDASNSEAAPNGMPEGMPPSGVNDAWRAGMGALKRFWGRIQGVYASTGSANAYVLSPDVDLAAYVTGERYSFRS